jgi:p-hydroxybenzoate 3-monooxygenase
MADRVRTEVGIVGAGPAGLVLSHLLLDGGIESVVLEDRSRAYVEQRVRAGVLEQGTVELLRASGLADRLDREALIHHGIEVRFADRCHRIPLTDLTGRSIWIYGQQELVKDLIAARLDRGGVIEFEVEDVRLEGIDSEKPSIRYRSHGREQVLECDVIAGCDGYHGVSRGSIPNLREYHREFPFAWLGILADVAPSSDELIYARHERGFALHSLRSPRVSRLYIQVDLDDDLDRWSDDRIWEELSIRLGADDGWTLKTGPILERTLAPLRCSVFEPMQHGRLYLAGDATHIVPATGAKGLNLAVADVRRLAAALTHWYRTGSTELLDGYSAACLRRVWRVEEFSAWMTSMLHRFPEDDEFARKLQLARLDQLASSTALATSLAENYVGLPFDEGG